MALANQRYQNLGAHIGVRCGPLERLASLEPRDYVYGTPTPEQQQLLMQQAALLAAPQAMYQPGPSALPGPNSAGSGGMPQALGQLPLAASAPSSAGTAAGQVGAQAACEDFLDNMLLLDMDEDCLRMMFGEDGEESSKAGGASSGQHGGERMVTRSTAAAATKAGAEAAEEEDDAVDLLFQDLSSLRHVASCGDLDLEVLHALQQDFDTASSGGEGAEGAKRARKGAGAPHLMLTMNYASAAQTINSLMDTNSSHGRKGVGSSPSGSLGAPPSPDSLASAGTQELERLNSFKRKRDL